MDIPLRDPAFRVVAVHGGAGFHPRSQSLDNEIKRALRSACTRAIAVLGRTEVALRAAAEAITILENDDCLNAGYGSNLTMSGRVECDASLMDGLTGDFGAVGAVSGIKNPITLAHSVLQHTRIPDPLGRIPPMLLVSAGAEEFARTQPEDMTYPPDAMISPRAQLEWRKWKDTLEAAQALALDVSAQTSIAAAACPPQTDGLRDRQDTVGAVVLDAEGALAAGVSSGGLLLKLPGRVGEAAIYGAGCWAMQRTACSVSGNGGLGAGEYITRMSLAKTICEALESAGDEGDTHEILEQVVGRHFCELCRERGEMSPQAGVILLVKENDGNGELKPRLWCAFTTESMAVGYASSLSSKPNVRPSPFHLPGPEGTSPGLIRPSSLSRRQYYAAQRLLPDPNPNLVLLSISPLCR
ncbi:N-terminal nucleophile aminohydrolase [Pilatotrama ljubarskyi]|nr:N-terminal nucleophile aminohydrolase [Pilatotrama ljubarskyi]